MDKEIMNALKKIKKMCKESTSDDCFKCPFGNSDGECMIKEFVPSDWKLRETEVYRYFE